MLLNHTENDCADSFPFMSEPNEISCVFKNYFPFHFDDLQGFFLFFFLTKPNIFCFQKSRREFVSTIVFRLVWKHFPDWSCCR